MFFKKIAAPAALGVAAAMGSVSSFAGAIVVTDTVTEITAQLVPIGLIGVAVLGVFVALKAYKWVRRAL